MVNEARESVNEYRTLKALICLVNPFVARQGGRDM